MNASVMNGNFNVYADFDKEKKKHMDMIRTERYKNYGQLENQASEMADVKTLYSATRRWCLQTRRRIPAPGNQYGT